MDTMRLLPNTWNICQQSAFEYSRRENGDVGGWLVELQLISTVRLKMIMGLKAWQGYNPVTFWKTIEAFKRYGQGCKPGP